MEKQQQEEEGEDRENRKNLPLNSNDAPTLQIGTEENQLEPGDVLPGGGNGRSDGEPGDAVSAMGGNVRSLG